MLEGSSVGKVLAKLIAFNASSSLCMPLWVGTIRWNAFISLSVSSWVGETGVYANRSASSSVLRPNPKPDISLMAS